MRDDLNGKDLGQEGKGGNQLRVSRGDETTSPGKEKEAEKGERKNRHETRIRPQRIHRSRRGGAQKEKRGKAGPGVSFSDRKTAPKRFSPTQRRERLPRSKLSWPGAGDQKKRQLVGCQES